MSETSETESETYERYILLSTRDQVSLIDSFTNAAIRTFKGADRLARALAFYERYNERWELSQGHGCSMCPEPSLADEAGEPAEDMTVTQPIGIMPPSRPVAVPPNAGPGWAYAATVPATAKRERLAVALAEVTKVEAEVLELLRRDQQQLDRATALRLRLETALMAMENGLSSTESAERVETVPASTPTEFEVGEWILWASWNGPRAAKVLKAPYEHAAGGVSDAYYVQVEASRTHPTMGGFTGWIPAAELHHVGD
jgi:hypothetical protein